VKMELVVPFRIKGKMIENKKLSEIMIEMAEQILERLNKVPSNESAHAALLLASVAWNQEIMGDAFQDNKQYNDVIKMKHYTMISCLRKYKRRSYPSDTRKIISCGTNERENVQVTWK
jgi:hypothetical protein